MAEQTAYDPLLNEPLHRRAVFVMSARRPAMSIRDRRPRPRCTTCGAPLHHGDCLDCGPMDCGGPTKETTA